MFSIEEKKKIAAEIERLLLSFDHPEMPKEKPRFLLCVQGKEIWSFAEIVDPTTAIEKFGPEPKGNPWNEKARQALGGEKS